MIKNVRVFFCVWKNLQLTKPWNVACCIFKTESFMERVGNLCYFLKNKTMNTQGTCDGDCALSCLVAKSFFHILPFSWKETCLPIRVTQTACMIVSFTVQVAKPLCAHALKVFASQRITTWDLLPTPCFTGLEPQLFLALQWDVHLVWEGSEHRESFSW